jgi:aminopeptidase N
MPIGRVTTACGHGHHRALCSAMKSDTPPAIRLADYTPPPFLIDHVDLTVRLDGPRTRAEATYRIRPNPAVDHPMAHARLVLHADALGPVEVKVNGAPVEPDQTATEVAFVLSAREESRVDIATTLDPAANTALSGLYLTNTVYCTQCEAEGFRRIVPFLDRPDVLATYTVTLEADKAACPVLLSNGNPCETKDLADGRHSITWHDPHPKPSYLFALVGGKLDAVRDSFTTQDGRDVALAIYVEPGKADRAAFAMLALKRSMAWDEERFGRLYDLDVFNIVAVSDFNLGAMENKGLNIFNDKYILASPETATDEDYERIDAIIAHEYFHNWSGNRVTCRDWFQLCLKEGLTVFRDQEYTSDIYDRTIKRIRDVRDLWAHQFPEDGGPLAHAVRPDSYREINNFYTATVYEKGAEIVRMIASWLGPDRFRAAMDRYFATYDGQAVRLEDFLATMEAEADDLGAWPDFLSWYTQAGTPKVDVSWEVDPASGTAELRFAQTTAPTPGQTTKIPLPIACRLALVDDAGADVALNPGQVTVTGGRLAGDQFLLEEAEGLVSITGLPSSTIRPSLFRDYSAPVLHTVSGLDESDRLFLAGKDSNAFSSWAHLQSLYSDALQRRYHRLGVGEPVGDDTALFEAMMTKALSVPIQEGSGQATRAAAITLPSAQDLARTIGESIDPDRVVAARKGFSRDFCAVHGPALLTALQDAGLEDDGDIAPEAAARRALKIALLHHIAQCDRPDVDGLLTEVLAGAGGMTMRIKLLGMMLQRSSALAEPALTAFDDEFHDDPLTMDKWFAVQAMTGTADLLIALEDHRSYDRENPNRVRSLLGAFAGANLAGFHAADGSGYRLMASRIGELDALNPQLAARLAAAFRTWRTMENSRQSHARAALTSLQDTANISPDLADIVQRTLNG